MTGDCHAGICGSRGPQCPRPPDPIFSGESQAWITHQRRSAASKGVHPVGAPPIDPGARPRQGFIHDPRWIQGAPG